MARIYGLNGALRGKQGNNVFSIQNGTQVVKAYQPVVSNPRTFLQTVQRSKFALAGKISAVVPPEALIGISAGDKRSRRGWFVSNIARSATTTTTPSAGGTVIDAVVDYVNIRFANGSLPSYSRYQNFNGVYTGNAGERRLVVTIDGYNVSPIQDDAPEGYGELVIVCMFDPSGSNLDACQTAIRTVEDMTFTFAVFQRTGCHVAVYSVPFAPLNGSLSYSAVGAIANGAEGVELVMRDTYSLSGMRFGRSYLTFSRDVPLP